MRPDGDPDRDDYGLPRVDVVIPDDARELDRDLVAYRREERQRRRRARMRRLVRPFGRYGVAAPIIAVALLIAVVSGTLITVFAPRPPAKPSTTAAQGRTSPASTLATNGTVGGTLPMGQVEIAGKAARLVDLQGVLMIVPPSCPCALSVQDLARQAQQANLKAYVIGSHPWTAATGKELDQLSGAPSSGVQVVQDETGTLSKVYGPTGLTVVLVHIDRIIGDVRRSVQNTQWLSQSELLSLATPGAGVVHP